MKLSALALAVAVLLSSSVGHVFGQANPADELLMTAKEVKLFRVDSSEFNVVASLPEGTLLRITVAKGKPPLVVPPKNFNAPRTDTNVRSGADCLDGNHPGFLLNPVPVVPYGYRYVEVVTEAGAGQRGWVDRAKCINLTTLAQCYPLHPPFEIRGTTVHFPEPDFVKIPALILQTGNKTIVKEWLRINALFEESYRMFDDQTVPQMIKLSAFPQGSLLPVIAMLQAKLIEKKKMQLPELFFARAEIWKKVGNQEEALDSMLYGAEAVRLTNPTNMLVYSKAFVKLHEQLLLREKQPRSPRAGKAPNYFGEGVDYFWSRNYEKALRYFTDAVQLAPHEPLYWYYRALTYKEMGDLKRAERDARIGVDLEWEEDNQNRRVHDERFVLQALERVQGPMRVWLQQYRNSTPEFRID